MKYLLFFLIGILSGIAFCNKSLREHLTNNNDRSSSTFDVSMGASQKYGWGLKQIRPPPTRPSPPGRGPRPPQRCPICNSRFVINDFRGTCERCDITRHPEIHRYVLKSSIPPMPDMSRYILKTQIPQCPDMSRYILKTEIPNCPIQMWPNRPNNPPRFPSNPQIPLKCPDTKITND